MNTLIIFFVHFLLGPCHYLLSSVLCLIKTELGQCCYAVIVYRAAHPISTRLQLSAINPRIDCLYNIWKSNVQKKELKKKRVIKTATKRVTGADINWHVYSDPFLNFFIFLEKPFQSSALSSSLIGHWPGWALSGLAECCQHSSSVSEPHQDENTHTQQEVTQTSVTN